MSRNVAARYLGISLLGACLLVGGCHRSAKSDDQRTAAGQVMPGSISDAMLPYDTVRSQPQLAPARAASDAISADLKDGGGDEVTGGEAVGPGLQSEVKSLPGR